MSPPVFPLVSRMGNLIINPGGVTPGTIETAMRGPAWWLLDLSQLWGFPDLRGSNVIIPGADGRRALRQRPDQSTYVLPLQMSGTITASGAATAVPADPLQGFCDNLDYLFANVGKPGTSPTRIVRRVAPNGSTVDTAAQIFLSLERQKGTEAWLRLALTIPRGRFSG